MNDNTSIANSDDTVGAVITDDARQARDGRYGWLSLVVASSFGLVFAYFLWQAVQVLFVLPASLAAYTSVSVPWWVLVIGVLIVPIVFAIAVFAGRHQNVGRKAIIFIVALTVIAGLHLSIRALTTVLLVAEISTPTT